MCVCLVSFIMGVSQEGLRVMRALMVSVLIVRSMALDQSYYTTANFWDIQGCLLMGSLCVGICMSRVREAGNVEKYQQHVCEAFLCILIKCVGTHIAYVESLLYLSFTYPLFSLVSIEWIGNYNIFTQAVVCIVWLEGLVLFLSTRFPWVLGGRYTMVTLCMTFVLGQIVLLVPVMFVGVAVQPLFRLPEALAFSGMFECLQNSENTRLFALYVCLGLSFTYFVQFALVYQGFLGATMYTFVIGGTSFVCGISDIQMFVFLPLIGQIILQLDDGINSYMLSKVWDYLLYIDTLFLPNILLGSEVFASLNVVLGTMFNLHGVFAQGTSLCLTYAFCMILKQGICFLYGKMRSIYGNPLGRLLVSQVDEEEAPLTMYSIAENGNMEDESVTGKEPP